MSKIRFSKASNGDSITFDKDDVLSVDETINDTGTILTFTNSENVAIISTYEDAAFSIFGDGYAEHTVTWHDGNPNHTYVGRRATRCLS